ncbi:MAG: DUF4404 family protein [Gammaproteobacteria bacterium]|nr:DUF4404 family protein [Gammaproteobacteria bacterium]NND38656.1 DUF4404 family protein [Pseudomonadales bacterium]NNL10878.1 DUF4404 family protein [Pseudomonadales bacterium]NNM11734.1 DUF4404 family protein [Pseudomonadales bacterium]RZV57760.1 MAG: DUF4404 family protein [Pseudomonadales bacterium]
MSKQRIRELLDELGQELGRSDVDDEALDLFKALDSDIREASEAEGASSGAADADDELMQRARELEARFASKHPNLELFLREIADTLGKLGI